MSQLRITEAFEKYGASLRNVQWSVSAWAPDGALVVSLWSHHGRPQPPAMMEFSDSLGRWSGAGNAEFRRNITKAFADKSPVRLVVASTIETGRVEAGEDASKIKKDFHCRDDLVGRVVELSGDDYVIHFRRA